MELFSSVLSEGSTNDMTSWEKQTEILIYSAFLGQGEMLQR